VRGSVVVTDAESGETAIVCLELDDPHDDVVAVLRRTHFSTNSRLTGMPQRARVFGYQPRSMPRRDHCTAAALAREDPAGHAIVAGYAARVSRYYREHNPERYAAHEDRAARVLGEWQLPESVFTSGIINFNNPLLYHLDAGNVAAVWSNMLVFRDGVGGGRLAVPEYGISFDLPNNSLLMFDGQRLVHGVTPLLLRHADAYRFSVVFYSLQQMWKCLPIDEEIARAQQRRWERERRRAGLIEGREEGDTALREERERRRQRAAV
jgi:hypothetical protein